jgi:photosystem II stability/assembly factor-like uncharacterized protein
VLNENNCFVGGERGLLKSANGGSTWEKIEINIPGQSHYRILAIYFADSLHGWIGTNYFGAQGGLLMTTDGGYSWNTQLSNILRIFEIYFLNDQLGWFFSGSKCYTTSDGGTTWDFQVDQPYVSEVQALQFTTPNIGWAGGYVGLLHTSDGGNTWMELFPAGIDLYTRGIYFINPLEGWIVGYSGTTDYVIKTSDGGLSWEIQVIPFISYFEPRDIHFINNEVGWVVGTGDPTGVMLSTSNGGLIWEIVDFPNSYNLLQVDFIDNNLGWVLGGYGTILKTTNGGVTFIQDKNLSEVIMEFILSQNYPNPFNPSTSIEYRVASIEYVTLKIFDVLGREVTTLVNEEKQPGVYEVDFNAGDLASGVYYYQLKAGSFIETKKMILLR